MVAKSVPTVGVLGVGAVISSSAGVGSEKNGNSKDCSVGE